MFIFAFVSLIAGSALAQSIPKPSSAKMPQNKTIIKEPEKSAPKKPTKLSPAPSPSPTPPAWEAQYSGKLTAILTAEQSNSKLQIKWLTTSPLAKTVKSAIVAGVPNQKPTYETTIEGVLSQPDWSINWPQANKKGSTKPDKEGLFKITVAIANERTNVPIQLISPKGKTELRVVELMFPYFGAKIPTRWSFNAGGGFSLLTYNQEGFLPFTETALTVKGGFAYAIVPGTWDTGLSTFFTALPITTKGHKANLRFLGLNGRLGYRLAIASLPDWRFGLHTGVYYTSSISNDPEFGFTGMAGPQLFPTITRRVTDKTFATTYFKFSPVGSGIVVLDLGNREVAGGFAFGYILPKGRSLSATVDMSALSIRVEDLVFKSQSLSFGFSFAF